MPQPEAAVLHAEAWLRGCAGVVIVAAFASARLNGSMEWSWGWIVRFIAGAAWAVLIARALPTELIRPAVRALAWAALACLLLSVGYRADRGVVQFSWPIGPLTLTAALAGVWTAMAGGLLAGRAARQTWSRDEALPILVALVGAYVLQQSGRRAPIIGCGAALVLAAVATAWARFSVWAARGAVIIAAAALAAAGAAYFIRQSGSAVRETSGPIALRLAYWRESAKLIADAPLLGRGPDTFVLHMTNRTAPLRAVSPHVYHGNVDPAAHNEWLQAAVELGIPGALAYAALPLGLLVVAMRRAAGPSDRRELTLALAAGIAAIVVTESASVPLRGATMPVWYWTLIGLLTGWCRSSAAPSPGQRRLFLATGRIILGVGAAICLWVCVQELLSAWAATTRATDREGRVGPRLLAEKTLDAKYKAARAQLERCRESPTPADLARAAAMWSELYRTAHGYLDSAASYAECLQLAGRTDEARTIVQRAIERGGARYAYAANALYARLLGDDAVERLRCVQRALREGDLNEYLRSVVTEILKDPRARTVLDEQLPKARRVAGDTTRCAAAGNEVEWLRIAAFVKWQAGGTAEAIADQRLAAECYARLERTNDPYRRGHDAEIDAFFMLARMLYEADTADYREAHRAIVAAERFAILAVRHEKVARPRPQYGFLIGEAVPTEFPARYRALWRFSALLHVVTGQDAHLDARVFLGLPTEDWTEPNLHRELALLARAAHRDLSGVPADKRPAHYDQLPAMAERYERLVSGT